MPTRRAFTLTAIAAGAAACASVAGAALAFALSPVVRRPPAGGARLDLGAAKDFDAVARGAAGAVEVVVERRVEDGYMTRKVKERLAVVKDASSPSGLAALSTTCTHLGCGVSWNAARKAFLCPCHGGVYGPDGRVLAGPPPRPLARAPLAIAGGRATVDPAAFEA
ncbi:MAG TPA: Rieske 2Fe-2S domain-containing protein [Thermoanaerobaculia bacterium]|nr:Rieske 2Fe-2S domain-containing protein [Thermoanaerobaculia bacterium]